ncbi:MAG: ATP-binding cassette domain-containing protein [Candidatus Sericytochromatia bacterium]|nr:ATP-binding cassette domain-containing protein [Candidatus Sericytochromatia bacterium]
MDHRTEPVFTVTRIRHRHAAREVLQDVTLTVHLGDRLGLIGANGAGKTTMLRIMAGDLAPDAGEVVARRGVKVGYLPQDAALPADATVRDAVLQGLAETRAEIARYEALSQALAAGAEPDAEALAELDVLGEHLTRIDAWGAERTADAIMAHLALPPADRTCGTLSGGEARRVALARSLVAHPDFLILDEPTNHLDAATIGWLESFLAGYKGSLVLVTHDRYFLDRVATRMIELERGALTAYQGNYSDYLEAKAARAEADAHTERARQNLLKRELAWVRKQPQARQAKSQARVDAYHSLAAEAPPPAADEIKLLIPTGEVRLGRHVAELEEVGKRLGDRWLFRGLTLGLRGGERIGVVGANGLGKTTLMRVLQGLEPPDEGKVDIGPNTRWVYADQGRDRLDRAKTLLAEVTDGAHHLVVGDRTITARAYLRRFLFDDDRHEQVLETFSGGEQNRAQLAKLLAKGGNVLILDEPTNDLDLPTLRALEEALLDFPGCAIVVSHDRYFLNRVATSILAFEGDGRVVRSEGDYDTYLARAAARSEAAAAPVPKQDAAPARPAPRPEAARKLSFKEARELEGLPGDIEVAEAALAALEQTLADPDLYAHRGEEVPALIADAEARREAVARLYARWEELEGLQAGAR